MTRDATIELFSRLLDGDVTPAERRRAEALISADEEMREIYHGLRRVRGSLAELAEAEVPRHLGALVERRVALESERSGPWRRLDLGLRRIFVGPAMLPAFSVLLALAAMIYLLASGLHRFERAREPLILRPPPAALRLPPPREIAGRTFSFHADRWIEEGLSAAAVERAPRRQVAAGDIEAWVAVRPELAGLPEMGAVVLDLDGEIVELVFERDGR